VSLIRLIVDVGNSRIKFGLFTESRDADGLPKCWNSVTADVRSESPWSQIREWQSPEMLESAKGFVAGSNPAEIARVKQTWPAEWAVPIEVGYASDLFPLSVKVPEPGKVGIDRLLNAVAANRVREPGQPVLIVDTGTATTVDVLNGDGEFLGGAILPGFELSARALHLYTALLPLIPLEELSSSTPAAIGPNTRAAMKSGLFWGQVGAVKELLSQTGRALDTRDPLVLITGGGGAMLAPEIPGTRWMPHLSLQGLALVAEEPRPRPV
jgi:type III pantothenate kinase